MRKTTTSRTRRLAAALAVLGSCLALTAPAGTADAAPADPVPTVFFGDDYTANFGIAPVNTQDKPWAPCSQATQNYPAVATRRLADKGITLNVRRDVSCKGALIHHFWEYQKLLPGGLVLPQQDALKFNSDTRLIVGSMGINTLGFTSILKQCSAKLRGAQEALLPGAPVDANSPAGECRDFFTSGGGKAWLGRRFSEVQVDLTVMLDHTRREFPHVKLVLVGYPRLVPQDTAKCATPAPGQTELPFADIPQDALPILDQVQKRLDDAMKDAAGFGPVDFVDLYDHTGSNTACDGADRGIGGLLENSQLKDFGQPVPWYAHPNEKGRDIQATQVAAKIEEVLNR